MTLPHALRVDLQHSGVWNDITADIYVREDTGSVVITRGRDSEDSTYSYGSANLALKNADGKYSPRNPSSPLYGKIGRNTPVRIGLGRPAIGAAVAVAGVSTTSLVAPSITAETTGVQLIAYFATPSGTVTEPGGFTQDFEGTVGSWSRSWAYQNSVAAGSTGTETATHSTNATAYAAINLHVPGGSWGSNANSTSATAGADCTFNLTGLTGGSLLVATCFWNSDTGDRMQPPRIDMPDQGLGWYLVADSGISPDANTPRVQAWAMRVPDDMAGDWQVNFLGKRDGFTASAATCRVQMITGADEYLPRFTGEASEWPVRWNRAGTEAATPITVAGVGRRLRIVDAPALPPTQTAILSTPEPILGYWPMTDGTNSTSFASGLPGGAPLLFTGAPSLGAYSSNPAVGSLATFTSAGAHGSALPVATPGQASFGGFVRINESGTAAGANLFAATFNGGTLDECVIEYQDSANIRIKFDYGSTEATSSLATALPGQEYLVAATLTQDGADIDWILWVAQCNPETNEIITLGQQSGTQSTQTMGAIDSVYIGLESGSLSANHTNAPVFGHAFATERALPLRFETDQLAPQSAQALVSWNGQKASDRIHRLLAGAGSRVLVQHSDTEQTMGFETSGTMMARLAEAEKVAAGGSLFDAAGFVGLRHRGRVAKFNQAPRITLDYSAEQILEVEPLDDDQALANDVTVTRTGGTTARAVLESGALSVQPPPDGVGRYAKDLPLQLHEDSQAVDQAGWALAAGTLDKPRWPIVAWELSHPNNSGLVADMAYFDVGSVIRLENTPTFFPPGPYDLLVEGITENISSGRWIVTANLSPADVYRVAVLDETDSDGQALFRLGDDGNLTLASGIDADDTALSITVGSDGALLDTADEPYDLLIGGELMTATAVTGTSSPQTVTVIRSVNGIVKSHASGEAVRIANPARLGLYE